MLCSLKARFMGPTWGPPRANRTQVGPCGSKETCYLGWFLFLFFRVCCCYFVTFSFEYCIMPSDRCFSDPVVICFYPKLRLCCLFLPVLSLVFHVSLVLVVLFVLYCFSRSCVQPMHFLFSCLLASCLEDLSKSCGWITFRSRYISMYPSILFTDF